jgi:hypothetical protein
MLAALVLSRTRGRSLQGAVATLLRRYYSQGGSNLQIPTTMSILRMSVSRSFTRASILRAAR